METFKTVQTIVFLRLAAFNVNAMRAFTKRNSLRLFTFKVFLKFTQEPKCPNNFGFHYKHNSLQKEMLSKTYLINSGKV